MKLVESFMTIFFLGMEARGLSHRNPHQLKHMNLCKHICLVLMRCWKILTYYCLTSRRLVCNNFFRMVSLNLFFIIYTNLIKNNVLHNHIFINYKINHKYNIYNFYHTKMKIVRTWSKLLAQQMYGLKPKKPKTLNL